MEEENAYGHPPELLHGLDYVLLQKDRTLLMSHQVY